MRNIPSETADATSSRRTRCGTFVAGMSTPSSPVNPRARHRSKKASILWFTPPTAWIRPSWSTEPVTASACRRGTSAIAERSAYSSAEDAGRRERERRVPAIPASEIAREDEDALRVKGSSQRDLALDVDDLSAPQ